MSIGIPGIVEDVLAHAVENAVKVVAAAARVFAGGDHPAQTPAQRTNSILYGPGGPPLAAPAPSPLPPDGSGGLHDGADAAGEQHTATLDAASLTDEKLAGLLRQVFASNQAARDKVAAIMADIQAKAKQVGPELGDPAAVMAVQQYLDQKLGEIQKVLSDSQVDAKTQAAIMDALGEEYRTNAPSDAEGGRNSAGDNSSRGDSAGSRGDAGGADSSAGGGSGGPDGASADEGTIAAAGLDPVVDPLAGLGPLGMGVGADPLGGLAGLGSALPGMLGGLGAGMWPLDGLAPAMAGVGSALPGLATGLSDKAGMDAGKPDDFTDTNGPSRDADQADKSDDDSDKDTAKAAEFHDDEPHGDASSASAATEPAGGPQAAPASAATPAGAAPAAATQAGGDPQRTVTMPDGTPVTAADAHRAGAIRAVMGGATVTAGYEGENVQIPPPGTPVTHPVDRNSLQPGDYAQFQSKPPVMYMGNGKIWLDGQLQPLGALKSSPDFLGWTQPPASTPVPAAPPPATPPSGTASG